MNSLAPVSSDSFRLVAALHPLDTDPVECRVPVGHSILEATGVDSDQLAVTLNGQPVTDLSLRPGPGDCLVVVVLPEDDSGIVQIVATAALAALSFGVGGLIANPFWSAVASAATFAAGSLLLNSLIQPPVPDQLEAPEKRNAITGVRNQFKPYGSVPIIYGIRRVYPPYAAKPYTEIVGEDQYFNGLFALGVGDHNISEIKIGETSIDQFEGVELIKTKTPSWVNISEESLDVTLDDPNAPSPTSTATRTTAAGVERISVDLNCPAGLRYTNSKGEIRTVKIDFRIEFRELPSGSWQDVRGYTQAAPPESPGGFNFDWIDWTLGGGFDNAGWLVGGQPTSQNQNFVGPVTHSPRNSTDFRVTGKTSTPQRFGIKWEVPTEGQYEVRVSRTYMEQNDPYSGTQAELDKYVQFFKWTALRSHDTDTAAVNTTDVEYLQLRMKASDQLNGALDRFNVVAQRLLRTWDGATWTAVTVTRNPGWAFLDMLTAPYNDRALSDAEMDTNAWLTELRAWALQCDTDSRYFDYVIDSPMSLFNALRLAAGAGRASWAMRDLRFTVVRDELVTTPSNIITYRNSRNWRETRAFRRIPHALKVKFVNSAEGFRDDEVTVYDDGYSSANATIFEDLPLEGITVADTAWKEGRYFLASLRLRPTTYEVELGHSQIAMTRGDLVHLQNDASLYALGAARVVSFDGSNLKTDARFDIESGKSYSVKVEHVEPTGVVSVTTYPVTAVVGTGRNLFGLTAPIADIVEDDLVIFGETATIDVPAKVTRIERGQNHTARIVLVDHAPAILTADSGPIPPYVSPITLPTDLDRVVPPGPTIVDITSGVNQQQILPEKQRIPRMVIAFVMSSWQGVGSLFAEARIRPEQTDGNAPWRFLSRVEANTGAIATTDVDVGETYDVQVRLVSSTGVESPWSAVVQHQVDTDTATPVAPDGLTTQSVVGGIEITLDTTSIDYTDMLRLEVAVGTVNNRADGSTEIRKFSLPAQMDTVNALKHALAFEDQADRYFWARVVDALQNEGDWFPTSATAGILGNALRSQPDDGFAFLDAFSTYASESDFENEWNRPGGTPTLTFPANGDLGGNVLRAEDGAWYISKARIPFDPNARYRIEARVRMVQAPTNPIHDLLFLGVAGFASNRSDYVNNAGANLASPMYYFAANSEDMGAFTLNEWQTFVGYFQGSSASGSGGEHTDPNDPGTVHPDVRFIAPDLTLNWNGDGIMEVDYVRLERVLGDDTLEQRICPDAEFERSLIFGDFWDPSPVGTNELLTGGAIGGIVHLDTDNTTLRPVRFRGRPAVHAGEFFKVRVRYRSNGSTTTATLRFSVNMVPNRYGSAQSPVVAGEDKLVTLPQSSSAWITEEFVLQTDILDAFTGQAAFLDFKVFLDTTSTGHYAEIDMLTVEAVPAPQTADKPGLVKAGVERTLKTYPGYVDTIAAGPDLPAGWTATNPGTGRYVVTHNLGLTAVDDLPITVSAISTSFRNAQLHSRTTNSFEVRVYDAAGALQLSDIYFEAIDKVS